MTDEEINKKLIQTMAYYDRIVYNIAHEIPSMLNYTAELLITIKRYRKLQHKQSIEYDCFRLVLKLFGKKIARLIM